MDTCCGTQTQRHSFDSQVRKANYLLSEYLQMLSQDDDTSLSCSSFPEEGPQHNVIYKQALKNDQQRDSMVSKDSCSSVKQFPNSGLSGEAVLQDPNTACFRTLYNSVVVS